MQNKKILIIEDDSTLCEVLAEKLTQHKYNVSVAEDGEVGMIKIQNEKPDLILLDILMPKKNGMEVLKELHADDKLKTIPVIVISNSGQPVEVQKARELGAKEFLIKVVFDPTEVLEKVQKILKQESSNLLLLDDDNTTERIVEIDEQSENNMPNIENTFVPKGEKKGAQRKILIVEDDTFLRELFVHKMLIEGFDVEFAIDADQVFELLMTKKPEVILLDLILPGMDGFEILDKIKKDDNLKAIPVIIISNLGQKEDITKANELGAVDFLIKANYTLDEIIARVLAVLQKY